VKFIFATPEIEDARAEEKGEREERREGKKAAAGPRDLWPNLE
jgi:hypothetical protein